jgi:hypothetical protein
MTGHAPLVAAVPGGIHQTTSLNTAPHLKPYIMYRMTSDVSYMRGDDGEQVRSNGYMLFVHDVPGDYLKIEDIIEQLKGLFQDIVDQANGVVKSFWLETSDDIRDDDMGTITKFGRIQVIHRV